jgi:uncharacterized protein (UPF0332 family)
MLDEEARRRTFDHAMELWFEPEIRRRQDLGQAPKPFPLRAAQIILYADRRPHEVRLNEEVEAIGQMKLKRGITKKEGETIYLHELEEIPAIHLPDNADPNCGHFTLLLIGDRWYGAFDFRYNRGNAVELLSAAEEFFQSASAALAAGKRRPAIDNLFSAAELAAKAFVISMPVTSESDSKSHGQVQKRFNMFSRHGNIETEHRKAFNALSDARASARYVRTPLIYTPEMIAKWQTEIEGLISHVRVRLS